MVGNLIINNFSLLLKVASKISFSWDWQVEFILKSLRLSSLYSMFKTNKQTNFYNMFSQAVV